MPYLEHDLAGHNTVTLNRDAQTIQFDDNPPIALGFPPIGVRLSVDGQMALCEHGETGIGVVVDRSTRLSWQHVQTTGLYCSAWMPDNTVAVQRADQAGVDVFDVNPIYLRTVPAPYSATGIAYVTPQGEIVMTTSPLCTRTVQNVPMFNVSESPDGWLVGLGDGAPGGVIIRVSPQGVMEMCAASTQLPPRITTGGVCCWSGTDAPVTVTSWEPYRPADVPPVVVPPPKPILAPLPDGLSPEAWAGLQSDRATGPGNCTWSSSPSITDQRPVTETSAGAGTILDRTLLCGLWLSDQNNPPQTVEAEIAYAQLKQATAVYLHEDNPAQADNVDAAAQRVRLAGLQAIPALHLYDQPTPSLNGFTGCTMNLRTVGRNLDQLATNWAWFVQQLYAGSFEVAFLTNVFENNPANNLEVCWPELWEQVQEVLRRVRTPAHLPGWRPPVIVVPPPVKPPKPPRPPRPPQPEKPSIFSRKQ